MKTYCIAYTPKGNYSDPRMIQASREFIDDITSKQSAIRQAKKLKDAGALLVYIDIYDGEPDDRYQNLIDYIRMWLGVSELVSAIRKYSRIYGAL